MEKPILQGRDIDDFTFDDINCKTLLFVATEGNCAKCIVDDAEDELIIGVETAVFFKHNGSLKAAVLF